MQLKSNLSIIDFFTIVEWFKQKTSLSSTVLTRISDPDPTSRDKSDPDPLFFSSPHPYPDSSGVNIFWVKIVFQIQLLETFCTLLCLEIWKPNSKRIRIRNPGSHSMYNQVFLQICWNLV